MTPETILLFFFKFICIELVYVEVSWYCKKNLSLVFPNSFFFFPNIKTSNLTKFFYHRTTNCRTNIPMIFREIFGVFCSISTFVFVYSFHDLSQNFSRCSAEPWLGNTCMSSQRRAFMPLSWCQRAPLKCRLLSIPRRFLEDFIFQIRCDIYFSRDCTTFINYQHPVCSVVAARCALEEVWHEG